MGPGHCGSTLLDMMLGSHSKAFSLGEIHRMPSMLYKYDNNGNHPSICGICEGPCPFWNSRISTNRLKRYFPPKDCNLKSRLIKVFVTSRKNIYQYIFDSTQYDILIDSSKNQDWIKKQTKLRYQWNSIKPYLIYMVRDGRAIVNSYLRKYPEKGIDYWTIDWKNRIISMDRFYNHFSYDKMVIHYEELTLEPERGIQELTQFLGIEFQDNMLRYWEQEHHPVAGNLGTHSLVIKSKATEVKHYDISRLDRMNKNNELYAKKYYEEIGRSIKLDLRWKEELSEKQIGIFERIAGKFNKRFSFE